MTRSLLVLLPDLPDPSHSEAHWWEVEDGALSASGTGSEWLVKSARTGKEPLLLTGLVGPERVRLERRDPEALASAQARTVARLEAEQAALGPDPHAVAAADAMNGWIATTDAAAMRRWLDWAAQHDAELDQIVPLAALLPADGKWVEARIGDRVIVARDGLALPDEPALVEALVGDAFVDTLDEQALEARIVAAVPNPPIDLRSGRFARARRWAPDPARLREFAILVALVLLVALLIPIAKAMRWDSESDRLDAETAAIATAALARPVDADTAESELRAAVGSGAAGGGGTAGSQAFATLLAEMDAEPSVEASLIAFDASGTLTARLAAADVEAINRLLLGLQRRGWALTANPVGDGAGRAMVDLTLQGGAL